MPKLAVDPQALSGAGAAVISAGDGVAAALGPLTAGFGANTGQDSAGAVFGLKYQNAAKSLLQTVATGINACRTNGYKVELGAFNYSCADTSSTLGGGAATLPKPNEPAKFDAPEPPRTLGPGVPEPALWALVEALVGDLWPNGNPAQMHTAAGCWRTFGAALHGVKSLLTGPMSIVAAQQMPESAAIQKVYSKLGDDMSKAADECANIAQTLDDFGNTVQQTQTAIRDLLHRLGTASGLWNEAKQIFTGHGLDELKKVVNDIKVVLHHLGEEAQARVQALQLAVQMGDELLRDLQKDVRGELVNVFGQDVGNPLATLFDTITNIDEGLLKSIVIAPVQLVEQLNPMIFLSDPKGEAAVWEGTLKGLGEMVLSGMPGGDRLVDTFDPSFRTNMSKALLHLDDWSTARPGLGAGENAGDLLMLFIPGLGEAGAGGKVAEAGGEAARAADAAGDAGRVAGGMGKAGEVAGVGQALSDVTKTTSGLTKDLEGLGTKLPEIEPPVGRPVGLPPTEPSIGSMPPRVEPAPPRVDPTPPVTSRPPADLPAAPPPGTPVRVPASGPIEHAPPVAPAEPAPPPHMPGSPGGLPDEPAPVGAGAPHQAPAPAPMQAPPAASTPAALPHDLPPQLPGHGPMDGPGPAEHPSAGDPGHGPHDPGGPNGSHGDGTGDPPHDPYEAPDHGHDGPPEQLPNEDVNNDAKHPGASAEPHDQLANGEPVNVATGEYFLATVDLDLAGTLPLRLTRQHRSQFRHGLWFGPTWASTFDSRAVITEFDVTTIDADGTMLVFDHPAPGVPSGPRYGRGWTLHAQESGGYRLDSPGGARSCHFNPLPQLEGADLGNGVLMLSAVTDKNSNRIDLAYNDIGVPMRVEHSGGYVVDVASSGGRIRGYTVAGVPVRRFDYSDGDLTSVENAVGAVTRFSYDDAHRVVSWTDSIGAHYTNTYDESGRVVSQTGTDGIWSGTFSYRNDDQGRSTVFADALGRKTTYHFDADLRPTSVTDPAGRSTRSTFGTARDPLWVTDAAGATTSYRYDNDHRLTELTDPVGHVLAFKYAGELPTQTVGPDGAVTRYEYDIRGNLTAVHDAAGGIKRWERDESGALSAYVDPAGRRTDITCSPAGLPMVMVDALGNRTRCDYDDFGRLVSVTQPDGTATAMEYDPEGRLASRLTADGSRESWAYDGEGNCVAFTNGAGATTRWEYGYYDLVTARIDADGGRTEYGYNAARQLVSVINPAGLVWRFNYRLDGLLHSKIDFNGALTTYSYGAAGRLASRTNAAGQTVSYAYDVAGNLVAETSSVAAGVSDDLPEEQVLYEYDATGRRIAASSPAGRLDLARDPLGRVIHESWNGRTVFSDFNAAGDLLETRTPSGLPTRLSYDQRGAAETLTVADRPCEVTTNALGRATKYRYGTAEVDSTWDEIGRLTSRSVGVDQATGVASANYHYRADGGLTDVGHSGVGAPLGTIARYDSDVTGKLTGRTLPDGSRETFHFDNSQNLSARSDERWQYRGTLLIDDGRSRYGYDRAGRLTTVSVRRRGRKPDVWQYKWDAWNRLRVLVTPDGMTFRYTYDPLGRRVAKEGSDGSRTDFCWSAMRMVEEVAVAADATSRVTSWSYLPGELTPQIQVSQDDVDREFFALVTDQVGAPVALLDPRTGTLPGQARTSAWGLAEWRGVSTPWRFPGQYHDEESGLHYNFHRYYDPSAGRYISPDPLGLAPAPNPYSYPTNPTGWVDPLGLNPCQGGPSGDQTIHHYGPHESGPLDADQALVDSFRSGTYTEKVTTQPMTLYRAYTEGAFPLGGFWSRDMPMGPLQTVMDSALNPAWGNQATAVSKIEVPAGTTFFEGIVGPQPIANGGILLGGGDQIVFEPDFRIPMDWLR